MTDNNYLLKKALHQNFGKLWLLYLLLAVEIVNFLLLPYVLGKAINGVLVNDFSWMLIYAGQFLFNLCIVTFRRQFDTKLFTHIYTQLAMDVISGYKSGKFNLSVALARLGSLYGVVGLFESDLPQMIKSAIQVVGASVMLLSYSKPIFVASILFTIPLLLLNIRYSRKLKINTHLINNNMELQVDVVQNKSVNDIREYFQLNSRLKVKMSNLDAANFAKTEFLNIIIIGIAVYVIAVSNITSPGNIYSIIAYTLRFTSGFDVMPQLIDKFVFIKDLQHRFS